MGHEIDSYLGLNEIGSPSPMMNFITISCLFNCIFGFIRLYFLDLSVRIFGFIRYDFLLVPINNTLCYCF